MLFPLFILQAKMRLSPVQSIDFGMVARIQKRLPQYLKIAAQDPALTLTHILLGELKVIGWNLSGRFWRTPHPSKT
jgi:hypothetical protein